MLWTIAVILLTAPPNEVRGGADAGAPRVALSDENVEPVHTRRSGKAELSY